MFLITSLYNRSTKSPIRKLSLKIKMSTETLRNVEIKASLKDLKDFEEKIKLAEELTKEEKIVIKQHDVFFNSKEGRLKLRYLEDKPSELILYSRPDAAGPKLSSFHKVELADPRGIENILAKSNGVKGEVKKTRFLFIHENTRIHLDEVKGLGYFLEFEAVLKPEEMIESGQERCEKLVKYFNIPKEDLIQGAYMDKILAEKEIE